MDPTCPLCHAAPDSMWHRLWECQHPDVVAYRDQLDPGLRRRAAAAGRASLLYGRGWMVHPADAWPREQYVDDMKFHVRSDEGAFHEVRSKNDNMIKLGG